jgi:hypothetical protein
MNPIPLSFFPDPELGSFLRVLVQQCSYLERTGRTCAYFGFSPKNITRITPIIFRIGQQADAKLDRHFTSYATVKLHALYENPHFLTTFEMDGQEFHGHGEFVIAGGLSLPNNYVSVAAFPRKWNDAMAFLFGCYLEARARGDRGYSWLSNAAESGFGLLRDARVAELVVGRGALAEVLPEMRKRF